MKFSSLTLHKMNFLVLSLSLNKFLLVFQKLGVHVIDYVIPDLITVIGEVNVACGAPVMKQLSNYGTLLNLAYL